MNTTDTTGTPDTTGTTGTTGRPLRVVFAGTPVFAAKALEALLASRHEVVAVLSQPDRPSGRGQKLVASPVKQVAVAAGVPVYQPHTLRVRPAPQPADPAASPAAGLAVRPAEEAVQGVVATETDEQRQLREARNQEAEAVHAALRALDPDVMVVAAYGLLLPQVTLDLPRHGCLNIHASLLPRWRGAAPIQRAIEAGDAETGVGIMQMEAGLDTGPVGLERRTAIRDTDTAATLHDRLADMGAGAIVSALDALAAGQLTFTPQAQEGITYAAKIDKAQLRVDWSRPAHEVACHIRAFDPPGATTRLQGVEDPTALLRVFDPVVLGSSYSISSYFRHNLGVEIVPGMIVGINDEGVHVACGEGAVILQSLQRPGGRRQTAAEFLRGHVLLSNHGKRSKGVQATDVFRRDQAIFPGQCFLGPESV